KTAVTRDAVLATFDQFPDQVTPARSKLWVIRTIDLGNRCEIGVGSYPPREGESYNCLVSAVDEDGNEIAGIHLPDISRPVASHSGWNVRDPGTGSPDQQVPMLGFSRWFANTKADRYALGDPRLSINERYQNRDNYADLVRADAEKLVSDGYLLESDVEIVVCNAMERYNAVARKHAAG
ncbi:MAG: alpha/beta hydrolase domain-containing protein, partial [Gammaproteobacteria bacterium]|nr:alpha/beta hydrolase domain-containing protein [Gammaproteobacteria bacterium]